MVGAYTGNVAAWLTVGAFAGAKDGWGACVLCPKGSLPKPWVQLWDCSEGKVWEFDNDGWGS